MGCGGSKAAVGPAGDEPPAKAIEQQLLAEAGASMVGASGVRALLEELSNVKLDDARCEGLVQAVTAKVKKNMPLILCAIPSVKSAASR